MAAIQLADRQQIHGSSKHPDPGAASDRVEADVGGLHSREDRMDQQPLQTGYAEMNAALVYDPGNYLGEGQSDRERRYEEHKSGERPGDSNIEERPLTVDRRSYADERSERAQERRREEVRQAGVDPMIGGGEIVSEFVSQQDRQQSHGER